MAGITAKERDAIVSAIKAGRCFLSSQDWMSQDGYP